MQKILFIAHMPTAGMSAEDPDGWSRWYEFERASKSIAGKHAAMTVLSRNVFLHPAEGSDEWLAQLVTATQEFLFSHATYILSGDLTKLSK